MHGWAHGCLALVDELCDSGTFCGVCMVCKIPFGACSFLGSFHSLLEGGGAGEEVFQQTETKTFFITNLILHEINKRLRRTHWLQAKNN